MKESNRFLTTLFVALLAASSLPGCATGPILVDGRLQFPEYKFSVDSPSTEWRMIESKPPGAVVAWINTVTKSRIVITASKAHPDVSLRTVVEAFKAGMTSKGIPDDLARKFPGSEGFRGTFTVTIEEEKEINLDGKMFHRVILNYGVVPVKGISVSGKMIFYFFKGEEFIFSLFFNAVLGYYDKDLVVLEQMVRGLRVPM